MCSVSLLAHEYDSGRGVITLRLSGETALHRPGLSEGRGEVRVAYIMSAYACIVVQLATALSDWARAHRRRI